MTRVVDRGAIIAAYVGIGMAVTIADQLPARHPDRADLLAARPAGGPADRLLRQPARATGGAGPWSRILANALFAGLVTGLTLAR